MSFLDYLKQNSGGTVQPTVTETPKPSLFERAKNYVTSFRGVKPIDVVKEIPGQLSEQIGQPSMRAYAGFANWITGGEGFTPQGAFQQELYGTDQPINFTSVGEEVVGQGPIRSKYVAPVLGAFFGIADAIPGGSEVKAGAKQIRPLITKLINLADKTEIQTTLRPLGLSDDTVSELADGIRMINTEYKGGLGARKVEIQNIIDDAMKRASAVPTGPAQSVVQVVKANGENVFYTVSPQDLKILSEDLIDGTTRGVAGKKINGDIYHLTAKTPTQMMEAAGFKNGGEKTLTDIIEMIQPKGKQVPIRDANGQFRGSKIDTPAYAKVASDIASERQLVEQARLYKTEGAFIKNTDINTLLPKGITKADVSDSRLFGSTAKGIKEAKDIDVALFVNENHPSFKKGMEFYNRKVGNIEYHVLPDNDMGREVFDAMIDTKDLKYGTGKGVYRKWNLEEAKSRLSEIYKKAHTPGYKADIGQSMGRTLSFTQARKVLQDIFKRNIDLEVVLGKDMINEDASAEVLGRTVRVLAEAKNVEEFVVKHEGWHLFKRFLKQEKIDELNKLELKFMRENPDITARVKERYPDAGERELAEEVFADEFAKWYTTGRGATLSNGAKLSVAMKNAFDKFAQFVTRLFTNKKAILNEYETEFEGVVKTLREDSADTNKYMEALKEKPTAQAMKKENELNLKRYHSDGFETTDSSRGGTWYFVGDGKLSSLGIGGSKTTNLKYTPKKIKEFKVGNVEDRYKDVSKDLDEFVGPKYAELLKDAQKIATELINGPRSRAERLEKAVRQLKERGIAVTTEDIKYDPRTQIEDIIIGKAAAEQGYDAIVLKGEESTSLFKIKSTEKRYGDVPAMRKDPDGLPTPKENADNQLRAQEASVGKQLAPIVREGEPSQLTRQVSSLTNDIPSISEIVNLDRLDISDDAKRFIEASVEDVRPMVEAKVGKTLTNKEVREYAETNSRIIERTLGREQTQAWEAAMFNTREKLARLAERGVVDQEYIDTLLTVKSLGADLGRKLQSLSMTAQPSEANALDSILEEILKVTNNADEVLKAAEGVDFKNYDEAVKFYRKFVKPKMGDWIDLVRYNSMLSSPLTHIVNTFSNIVNSLLVGTLEKATVGGIDAIRGVFTGERKRFAGESVAFVDGYARNLGEATDRFVQALKGKNAITNLDTQSIPLTTKPGVAKVAEKVLSIPMRFLEASDQFFTALTEAGEMASLTYRQNRGIPVRAPIVKAQQAARYRLFRQELFPEGQGPVLNAVDKLTGVIYDMRHSKNPILSTIFKWTVPFVRTPMNIFKQGLEYSPIGLTTVPGAEDKELQLAKAAIGSTVFGVSALLLASDRITFAEPSSEKERTLWRDAGKQSYSIKMGDTWVSYQKLPPTLAFPISIVAALDQAQKERKVEDSTVEMILGAIAKYGNFLADQSYAKSIGDLLGAVKGGESEWARLAGNYPQQVLPFRALGGWLAKLIDNVQRKPDPEGTFIDKQVDLLLMNIPGLSDKAPARTNQFGDEITNEQNIINAFSPVRVSEEKPEGAGRLIKYLAEKMETAKEKEARDTFKAEVFLPIQELSTEEAQKRLDAMTDEEYEMYKTVRTSWRSTNMRTVRDFLNYDPREAVQFIRELPEDEADRILNLLTDEEYALYQTGKPE